ncbi:hypothetical protein M409DRAFT_18754 [Zasmidium cellare ATCC 36951]|uniref:BTB domain-containing protein n=1 Tax=Zasmidium cellare ATCC 36951 TaxID=1080233 RepID=A0A6A6CX55_ZASCE|nr:uncharacterized protein M409DRAFT_18754 [Zasmidium cellare ATCC 36951]KAF2170780.1 hypothetical protein M409DRAFT_18754 [Zasmidium cellare ATCC 36951]
MSNALVRTSVRPPTVNQRPKKFDYTDQVTVNVGTAENRFMVHKDVLMHRCSFFQNACAHALQQSNEQTIWLPEVDRETFQCYLQWAYSGKVVVATILADDNNMSPRLSSLVRLYAMAIHVDNLDLKNATVNTFLETLEQSNKSPTLESIKLLWSSTPNGCKLRQAVVDWFAFNSTGQWLERWRQDIPDAFYAELGITMAKANWDKSRVRNPLLWSNWSHYYELDDELASAEIDDLSERVSAIMQ